MPHVDGDRRWLEILLPIATVLAVVGTSMSVSATVTEPDGTPVPQPLSEDLRPYPGNTNTEGNMSLQALFTFMREPWAADWQVAAAADPQVFSPLCGFTGRLLMRGGGCAVNFGWYNVVEGQDLSTRNPDGTLANPPPIFPLLTTADYVDANGNEIEAFYPRVPEGQTCTDPPVCPGVADWAPLVGVELANIRSDPNYLGGLIGFAVQANPNSICTQDKYSQPDLNVLSVYNGQPWISAIVYVSQSMPNSFYIAFEDLPVAPDDFALPTQEGYVNDGDFNDFVYLVSGVTCEGGGTPCSTGSQGACGFGLLECQPGGGTKCEPQFPASEEVCDNIDNDCDGEIDEGDLCDYGECFRGVCVGSCSTGEFPCPGGLTCDADGKCVDLACEDVSCGNSQVCIGGQCVGGCEGVQCPLGQSCQMGRCVDACAQRTCPAGQVCEGGICVENCSCRVCPPNWTCDSASGSCVVVGCEGASCGFGEVCIGGDCFGACEGVTCPGGAGCTINAQGQGECGTPVSGYTPDTSLSPNNSPYSIPAVDWTPPSGSGGGTGSPTPPGSNRGGCGCRAAGSGRHPAALALLLLSAAAAMRRRRG